ncbi:MAG: hypothetical protein HRU09_18745 [Oligoflexales bacterium]|nr:hypothetical protein [Oligoflexales bacterium]
MGTHLICLIIIFFSLCTRLSASQALHAQSPRSKQYLYDNIRIGAGYDSISGEFKKNCIVKVGSPITFEFSDQKLFELQQINSLSQLVQALELPLTAILPSPPHPLFKEKNDFLKLIAFNRFNSFMLAKAKISLTEKNIGDSILKEKYIGYLKENGIGQFTERCGDSYLSKYSMGIEYFFLFEFSSHQGSIPGRLSSILKDLHKKALEHVTFFNALSSFHSLGIKRIYIFNQDDILTIDKPNENQLSMILSQIQSQLLNKKSKPHSFTFSSYSPLIEKQKPHPNNGPLDEILRYYATNQETLLDLTYISAHPDEFSLKNADPKLAEWNGQARYNLSFLSRLFSQCLSRKEDCENPKHKFFYNPRPNDLAIKQQVSPSIKHHSCMTTVYKLGRGRQCGVASYLEKRMPYCGVARYQKAPNKLCPGSIPPLGPKILKKGHLSLEQLSSSEQAYLNQECQEMFGKDWIYSDFNPVHHGPLQPSQKTEGQVGFHTCIRLAKIVSCRHPSHGVEAYKKCEHPSHGVNQFKECRSPEFGVQYRLPRACKAK